MSLGGCWYAAHDSTIAAYRDGPRSRLGLKRCTRPSAISGVKRLVLRDAPGLESKTLADYSAGTIVLLQCDEPIMADGLMWQRVHVANQDVWMSRRMLK